MVGPLAAARITLGCPPADQIPIRIERAQQPRLVGLHVGLNSLQRVLGDEECNLHRAVVSPKTHRAPRCIERAALIGKTQRHCCPSEAVSLARSRELGRQTPRSLVIRSAAPNICCMPEQRLRPVSLPPAPVLLRIMADDG